MTDTEREPITTSARLEMWRLSVSEAPMTTGSNGNIHGARTVNIPAKIEMARKITLVDLCYQTT